MKSSIFVDIEDVIDGLAFDEKVKLAKELSKDYLDIEELLEIAHSSGYKDEEILNELDWDEIKKFVKDND